ncbi:MAG: helix-turn-helix domain-containing protein [Lachnospiraceae bacterium]|nr:helix-turn-helix domain-containing protein [Lachnospiraceae bacterium]
MKKAAYNILPATEDILKIMGEQIKLARLRRDLSAELVAERAGISRSSLWKVESGNPAVAIGIYAAVLHALGEMDKDLILVAKDDDMGRQMQDLNLLTRKRASRRNS